VALPTAQVHDQGRHDVGNRGDCGAGKSTGARRGHRNRIDPDAGAVGKIGTAVAFLGLGERVRLQVGPLVGAEGIFLRVKEEYQLVVSVTLLQRSVSVTVEK
jgi:hypothetical protein